LWVLGLFSGGDGVSTYCEPLGRLYGSKNSLGDGLPLLTYGEAMPNKVLEKSSKKSSR
jgi:hypothetical protein